MEWVDKMSPTYEEQYSPVKDALPDKAILFSRSDIDINTIYYEISGICNAKCTYCPTGSGVTKGRPARFIPPEEFSRGLNRLYELDLLNKDVFFGLFNWGDPLLHPRLDEILHILKEADQSFALSTNGSFIPKNLNSSLLDNLSYIRLSLPGFSQKSYDKIHRLDFEKVLQNIGILNELVPPNTLEVLLYAYKFNIEEIPRASEYFSDRNIQFRVGMPHLMDYEDAVGYLTETIDPVKKQGIEDDLFTDHIKSLLLYKEDKKSCPYLQNQLVIDEYNNVLTCCVLSKNSEYYTAGSLFELTKDEIFDVKTRGRPVCFRCMSAGVPYWYEFNCRHLPQELQAFNTQTYCYIDTGYGFSEKQKISSNINSNALRASFHVFFDLRQFKDIRSLRWDPVEGRLCHISIDKIQVEMKNGDIHLIEPANVSTNGERVSDDEFRFNTIDPWIVVQAEGQINNVVITGSWLVKDIEETIPHLNQKVIQSNVKVRSLQQTVTEHGAQVVLLDERVEQLTEEIQSLQRTIAERDAQVASLDEQIALSDEALQSLKETLADRDTQVASLDEQTRQQATQLMQLSNELASVKQSIVWRLLMKFHNGFVERVLPPSTRRREIYDLGLKGGRILFDGGLRCLWLKAGRYYKFRKNVTSHPPCCADSNDIKAPHKFCKAMNDDVIDSLILKYIRGKGICVGTDDSPCIPRNVDIVHVNVDDAKALLKSNLSKSRTSCHSGITYTEYEPKSSCLDFCMVLNIIEQVEEPQIFLEHCLNSLKVGGLLYLATDDRFSSIIRGFLSSNTDAGRYPPDGTGLALDSCYQNDYISIAKIGENQKTPQGEAEHVYIIEKTGYLGQIEDLLKTSDALVTQDEFNMDVIIPVYNAYEDLIRCTYSVFKHWDNFRVILINDCSTDARISDLFSRLRTSKSDRLLLLENEENLGFVKTVNRGMKYSKNDVVLLNSDTIVTRGWAEKLRKCAYSSKDIATVTPFTNNGTICSVPSFCEENDIPSGFTVDSFAEFIEKISFREYPEIPTAVGFCMYIKREALERVGYFDEESFGKGYGEENDFCMRAKDYGYNHVLCDDTFVFHKGEGSFSAKKAELCRKNLETLSQKYPEYLPIVHEYIQSNPSVELHKNIRLRMRTWDPNGHKKKILFFLHTWGGGTEKHVRDLIDALRDYIFYVLQVEGARVVLTEVNNGHEIEYVFSMKSPLKQFEFHNTEYEKILLDITDQFQIDLIHIHHLIGHSFDVTAVAKQRNIPLLYTVHDYYSVCPNINLLDCNFELCLGDNSIEKCDVCLKKSKGLDPGFIKKWRSHFNGIFESCEAIVCPSQSVSEILSMYYPNVGGKMTVIEHGIDEGAADPAGFNGGYLNTSQNDLFHIAYIGGLGPNKGRDLFYNLASAKEFEGKVAWSIFGISDLHSKPGYYARHNVHIYGLYNGFDELKTLIDEERVNVILFPSVCPETYSYTLSEAWAMGIPVIVSGLGALKERVEKHGGGWVVNGSDLDDFKAKIIELLNSPEDYSEKKREVMAMLLKSVAEMAEEYRCLYTHHIEMTQGSSKNRSATSNYIFYRSMRIS
jgi:GT2 family glycosyltransferase/molybdenum cofactor biosynthesis enzyme MoaA